MKSRLSRGRERLLRGLIRRGFGPEESLAPTGEKFVITAVLASETIQAMLRFGAVPSMSGLISAGAVAWAVSTLRSMQLNRVVAVVAMLCAGISSARRRPDCHSEAGTGEAAAPVATLTKSREPEHAPATCSQKPVISVRVIDHMGRGVRNASVPRVRIGVQLCSTRISHG